MARKSKGHDPVVDAVEDGSYSEFLTPLNAPKSEADPQANLDNAVIPWADDEHYHDPLGLLNLTGPRGRRGDPEE